MLLSEFIDMTGFHPSSEEYREIEKKYYDFKGDKQAFCKAWKRNHGILGASSRMNNEIFRLKEEIRNKELEIYNISDNVYSLKCELNKKDAMISQLQVKISNIMSMF